MSTRSASPARPSLGLVLRAGATSAVLSLIGSTLLFGAARLAGLLTLGPDAGGAVPGAPGLLAIAGMALAAPTVATMLFAGLVRFAPRPGAIFVAIALMVLVGFTGGPLTLDAPVALMAVLEVMHLTVAAVVVGSLLATLPPRRGVEKADGTTAGSERAKLGSASSIAR